MLTWMGGFDAGRYGRAGLWVEGGKGNAASWGCGLFGRGRSLTVHCGEALSLSVKATRRIPGFELGWGGSQHKEYCSLDAAIAHLDLFEDSGADLRLFRFPASRGPCCTIVNNSI